MKMKNHDGLFTGSGTPENFESRRMHPPGPASKFSRIPPWLMLAITIAAGGGQAEDWPHWRGPDRNGISRESDWKAENPRRVWQAKVGTGFSSVSVAQGRVFTMGNRRDQDTVYCLSEETGKELWKNTYPSPQAPRYYDGGPSCTPTVDGEVVYTLGRQGDLFAFQAADGAVLWQKNIAKEIGAEYPEWGYAGSPFVDGEALVLNVGKAGVKVNKKTGRLIWQTGTATSGYSTPFIHSQTGTKSYIIFGATAAYCVAADTGKALWRQPWRTEWDINSADPIVHEGKMFLSSGYNRGGALLDISGSQPKVIWDNRNMRNHFNSCLLIDGHLYGFDGNSHRGTAYLACIEIATGEKKWSTTRYGCGALTAANGKLIVLGDRGQLAIGKASPDGFRPTVSTQALGGLCWTPPVLANGNLYCRNSRGDLACLSLTGR
jgi:outer membrane protein assembly factor BamB